MLNTYVNVFDHGQVMLQNVMGDDLEVVNAAKVSFDKRAKEFGSSEERLLKFLLDHEHNSVLRHCVLKFEVYAPLMVARQWWKYRIGSNVLEDDFRMDGLEAWNESSRRYITENVEFYVPEQFKYEPANKKQGSGDPLPPLYNDMHRKRLAEHYQECLERYEYALSEGICPEQARLFLPAYGLYVRFLWTCSLGTVLHFLQQRLADDAQEEIQQYAQVIQKLAEPHFTKTFEYFGV